MTENTQSHDSGREWASAARLAGAGRLSVLMPAHNLGGAIAANVRRVRDVFAGRIPFEIVVVDDGSTDATRAELERAAAEIPEVKPVFVRVNVGKGAALRSGFQASTGTHLLLLDADLDIPPEQVTVFFDIMERENADVVIGAKRHPDSRVAYPWHRRLTSIVYFRIVKLLFGLPIRDTQTGFKLFKRATLEWALPRMLVKQFAFDLELLAIIHGKGFRIAEAPVVVRFQSRLGCVRPSTVKQIMIDTLAIFYRLRLLRYYQSIRDVRALDPPPLVSIVVAFPAASAYLDECIDAVRRQTCPNWELILLPDAPTGRIYPPRPSGAPPGRECSSHQQQAALPSLEGSGVGSPRPSTLDPRPSASIREIPTGCVRPAEKRNIGIREARGEIVAFLDDDAFPVENWLHQAMVYAGDPAIAAIGGPATTPIGDPYLAQLSGRVYGNPLVSGSVRYRYEPDRVREVDDFPSCNLFVRTDVLRTLGGFRTDFWPGEDTHLCMEIVRRLGRTIVYDPRVHVYHHRRPLFLPHLRQIARYALHRGWFARRFPDTSRRVSYMLPSALVLGIVAGAVAVALVPVLRAPYAAALALYLGLTFLAAMKLRNPLTWLLTWLGIVATHLVYGVRFLQGLLFGRLPTEVRRFDHKSEAEGGRWRVEGKKNRVEGGG
jgi:glycosyltransferase involved in cell wall biosynthesis